MINQRKSLNLIIVGFSAVLMMGCFSKKVDYLDVFRFNGKIISEYDKQPIAGGSISFIDIGFDDHRKESGEAIKVCESSDSGEFSCEFEYFWGTTKNMFSEEPTKEFIIRIKKNNYHNKELPFYADKLKKTDGGYRIDIGDILLKKRN
jgi:hypothetical protein